jgi:undecaprenyl diphosphate synthase
MPQVAARADGPAPLHVAIIMDGNGRWASRRGLPRALGHRRGVDAVKRTVEAAPALGVRYLTLFGFSTENWRRPADEVATLMRLLLMFLRSEISDLHAKGVCLRFIGERDRLPSEVVALIEESEALTRTNPGLRLTIALSYGARQEITHVVRRIAEDVAAGRLAPGAVDEAAIEGRLFTADLPDPDLIIRTSGEQRVSNFLLWQAAYAELVFVDTLWPDFQPGDLEAALSEYQRRDRRYGTVGAP